MSKTGRHAPAFILLMLAEGPKHGLGILSAMDQEVAGHRLDTAVIYRTLKQMEKDHLVVAAWVASDLGPKKKVYSITSEGRECLASYRQDIEACIQRLNRFIAIYDGSSDQG